MFLNIYVVVSIPLGRRVKQLYVKYKTGFEKERFRFLRCG